MKLETYRELEDAIAEDPFDEARWFILEDWLLERGDPRAELIQLEKQQLPTKNLLAKMAPLLLGDQHVELDPHLYQRDWRAGFLRQCQFTGPAPLFEAFLASPASALLRAVQFTVYPGKYEAVDALRDALCLRSLRTITISSWSHYANAALPRARASQLVLVPNLSRLVLRGLYIDQPLDRLRALVLAPMRGDLKPLAELLAAHVWIGLHELTYQLPDLLDQPLDLHDLAPLANSAVAPALQRLIVENVPSTQMAAVQALFAERGVSVELR